MDVKEVIIKVKPGTALNVQLVDADTGQYIKVPDMPDWELRYMANFQGFVIRNLLERVESLEAKISKIDPKPEV